MPGLHTQGEVSQVRYTVGVRLVEMTKNRIDGI